MLNFSGLECHASVWVCGSRAKYGQLSYKIENIKRTSKNQGFGVLRGWEMLGAWTACRTARSGEGFEVDVVFDSACLLFHLIHKELSGSIGIMASKSASSSLLHQLETPQAPQIARTNQRLWWFVVINHAKLEVPTLTHTHAPTRFSQLPFWAPSQSCSFQHLSTHFLAPECHPFFLEANQRNGLSPVCFTVRQSSFRGAGAMLGPGPDWTLAPSWAGLGAATSQKFELHGRVSNFWILHLIHLIFPDLLATHWRNHQRTWFLDFGSWSLSPTLKYRTSLHPKFLGLSYGLSGSGTSGSGAWPGAFCTRQRP